MGRYVVLRVFIVVLKIVAVLLLTLCVASWVSIAVSALQAPTVVQRNPTLNDIAPVADVPVPGYPTGIDFIDGMVEDMRELYLTPLPVREAVTAGGLFVGALAIYQALASLFFGLGSWALADYLHMRMASADDIHEMVSLMRRQVPMNVPTTTAYGRSLHGMWVDSPPPPPPDNLKPRLGGWTQDGGRWRRQGD